MDCNKGLEAGEDQFGLCIMNKGRVILKRGQRGGQGTDKTEGIHDLIGVFKRLL